VTDPEAIAFAHRMFDLARAGDDELLTYLDKGLPLGLTDASGNTLLMLAAYHGHAQLVAGLAGRGADPNAVNDRARLRSPVLFSRARQMSYRRSSKPARIPTWAARPLANPPRSSARPSLRHCSISVRDALRDQQRSCRTQIRRKHC
jgi:ankyrin repeat protein